MGIIQLVQMVCNIQRDDGHGYDTRGSHEGRRAHVLERAMLEGVEDIAVNLPPDEMLLHVERNKAHLQEQVARLARKPSAFLSSIQLLLREVVMRSQLLGTRRRLRLLGEDLVRDIEDPRFRVGHECFFQGSADRLLRSRELVDLL